MLGYKLVQPDGASEVNVSRARVLFELRKNRFRLEERKAHAGEYTLEELSGHHDPEGRRKKGRTLRNEEFSVALILDVEGRGDAVPPSWRELQQTEQSGRFCQGSRTCAAAGTTGL